MKRTDVISIAHSLSTIKIKQILTPETKAALIRNQITANSEMTNYIKFMQEAAKANNETLTEGKMMSPELNIALNNYLNEESGREFYKVDENELYILFDGLDVGEAARLFQILQA